MSLNFATHCASTACGISSEHLLVEDAMIRSIYCFHVVFQTQEILNTLEYGYLTLMSLTRSRASITSRTTGSFAIVLTWKHLLIGGYKYNERRFIQDGKTGHYIMANSAMGGFKTIVLDYLR